MPGRGASHGVWICLNFFNFRCSPRTNCGPSSALGIPHCDLPSPLAIMAANMYKHEANTIGYGNPGGLLAPPLISWARSRGGARSHGCTCHTADPSLRASPFPLDPALHLPPPLANHQNHHHNHQPSRQGVHRRGGADAGAARRRRARREERARPGRKGRALRCWGAYSTRTLLPRGGHASVSRVNRALGEGRRGRGSGPMAATQLGRALPTSLTPGNRSPQHPLPSARHLYTSPPVPWTSPSWASPRQATTSRPARPPRCAHAGLRA